MRWLTLSFGRDNPRLLLTITQPFVENDLAFVRENTLFERRSFLSKFRRIRNLTLLDNGNNATVTVGYKLGYLPGLHSSHGVANGGKIRAALLRFFRHFLRVHVFGKSE